MRARKQGDLERVRGANGYVKGEGVGAVLLKPLSQAEADGDHIHAMIRASAENHGGRAHFLTAPNPEAQARLLVSAYRQSGLPPETISYIETHGTETELGDPIEVQALRRAFAAMAECTLPVGACGIGSVKTNIGHALPAAGIARLIKVLLALRARQLPPSLHCTQENSQIAFAASPFRVQRSRTDWPLGPAGTPRRAALNSFGFSGTNAHLVIEEAPPARPTTPWSPPLCSSPYPHGPGPPWSDVSPICAVGWTNLGSTTPRATAKNDKRAAMEIHSMTTVCIFPGQGAQQVGMGQALFERYPELEAEASDPDDPQHP